LKASLDMKLRLSYVQLKTIFLMVNGDQMNAKSFNCAADRADMEVTNIKRKGAFSLSVCNNFSFIIPRERDPISPRT
jgi:hypothetical protein